MIWNTFQPFYAYIQYIHMFWCVELYVVISYPLDPLDSYDKFAHIFQGYFTGNRAVI